MDLIESDLKSVKVFAAVQARLGSKRLPDKVLIKIGQRSVVEWIILRLRQCKKIDGIVLSTSDLPKDDPLQQVADSLSIPCFRGSEIDLIQRLLGTVNMTTADALVRVTADCPLVDYQLVDQMVQTYRQHVNKVDVITNIHPPTFPDGLDIEILSRIILKQMDLDAKDPLYREWLTMYLYKHPEKYRILNVSNKEDLSDLRWTLDYPEDLEFIRCIYSHFEGSEETFTMGQVLKVLEKYPEVTEINRRWVEKVKRGIRSQAFLHLKKECKHG